MSHHISETERLPFPDLGERKADLTSECEKLGRLLARLWESIRTRAEKEDVSSELHLRLHSGQTRWITIDAVTYTVDRQGPDALLKSFTVRLDGAPGRTSREW